MRKYIALIYRELKISRRLYLLRLLILIMLSFLVWAVGFTVGQSDAGKYIGSGNLDKLVNGMFFILIFCTAILSTADNGVYKSDVNSKWLIYSYAVPISALNKAVTRYILKVMSIAVGMGVGIGNYVIFRTKMGEEASKHTIMWFIWILNICLLYDFISQLLALSTRKSERVKRTDSLAMLIFIVLALVCLKFIPLSEINFSDQDLMTHQFNNLKKIIEPWALPVLGGLLTTGFFTAWLSFKRREA